MYMLAPVLLLMLLPDAPMVVQVTHVHASHPRSHKSRMLMQLTHIQMFMQVTHVHALLCRANKKSAHGGTLNAAGKIMQHLPFRGS